MPKRLFKSFFYVEKNLIFFSLNRYNFDHLFSPNVSRTGMEEMFFLFLEYFSLGK